VLLALWSPKGGSGTSVLAAACALTLARASRTPSGSGELAARLVDLDGDLPAIFGLGNEPDTGVADWLAAGPETPGEALERLTIDVATGVSLLPLGNAPGVLAPPAAAEAGAALAVALRDAPAPTIVDLGRADMPATRALLEVADVSLVVLRPCYLALRRAVRAAAVARAAGVVLVEEPDRALAERDVVEVLDVGFVACVPWQKPIARAVDAGILARRLPESLARSALQILRSAGVVAGRRGAAA
jgi:cellulose biosynthesis protein BcsQ